MHHAKGWLVLIGTGVAFGAILLAQQTLLNPFDFQIARQPLSEESLAWASYLAHTFFPAVFASLLLWYWLVCARIGALPQKTVRVWIVVFFLIFSAIAVATSPTKSQDVYWNLLLAKGWVVEHLNPYLTAPDMLRGDPWFAPYINWTHLPMMYGPLWTYLIAGAVYVGQSLAASLFLMKLAAFASLLLSGYALWRIMALHRMADGAKNAVLLLLAWNPAVLQLLVMDAHNDFLIVPSILFSYLFFKQEKYAASALLLLLGGFVKYVPFFLLPIPLFYLLFRNNAPWLKKCAQFGGVLLGAAGLAALLYAPFGGISASIAAAGNAVVPGTTDASLFPTMALATTLGLELPAIRAMGILAGVFVLLWFVFRNKPLLAYTFPFLAIFIFGTPWFLPWYALWIFPLLALIFPVSLMLLLSVFLILIPSPFSPLTASYLFASLYIAWKLLFPLERAAEKLEQGLH
ncbi:MAG: hypothetical protein HYW65_02185 [Candidatus Liptonbacteria bacterium]|nr:hypothetical protein [Candidatus Liptonbacteria bacterium]